MDPGTWRGGGCPGWGLCGWSPEAFLGPRVPRELRFAPLRVPGVGRAGNTRSRWGITG